jgi:dTDP-4-amino-4,6-dideoxygalactose transaminase
MLKLFQPFVSKNAIKYLEETLYSGQIAEGPKVAEFEELFGETFNKKNVVSVNSGTSALELAYVMAGLKEGDEVITPVLTCTATNLPLVRMGVKIVWGDVNKNNLTLSVPDVLQKITEDTKAIIFVHFGGNNYGLKALRDICKEKGIILIEDAAQAVGSDYWGVGDHTAVSLQAIKTITSGDGGVYLGKQYAKAKRLRWFGYNREEKQRLGDTDLLEAGYKWHMNDISACIGIANLEEWDKIKAHKDKINAIYKEAGMFAHPWMAGGFTDRYDELVEVAKEAGFEVGQHHYRNDKYSIFGGRWKLPNMDAIEGRYFFVPSHMGVTEEDARNIVKVCKPFLTRV